MDDYIKRSDALNFEWSVECDPDELQAIMTGMAHVMDYIKHLPAADVAEVVHGKWVHNETYELANGDLVGEAYCTNCELYSSQISTPDGKVSYSVCPRCGAKMGD